MTKHLIIPILCCLLTLGCFQKREYNRYIDTSTKIGESEGTIRLIGKYHPEGKTAVGHPYQLFVSFYPIIDDLDYLTIKLSDKNGEIQKKFKSVQVNREKAFNRDGDFQYASIDDLSLDYIDYFITIETNLDSLNSSEIHLKRINTSKIENSWWSKASSI